MDYFIPVNKFSLFNKFYFYLDHKDYYADSLFAKNGLKLHFMKEYKKEGLPYVVIYVRCPKKQAKLFERICNDIPRVMLLRGCKDYESTANGILSSMRKEDNSI